MPIYKEYETEEYELFLNTKFNTNYGISEEDMAEYFMSTGTEVIGRYGITYNNLLDTYIPLLNERLGAYAFFLLYTITEGGGAGGWINHYFDYDQDQVNGVNAMNKDIDYLLSVDKSLPVAKNAPEVLDYTNYVDDIPGSTDAYWEKVTADSIGNLWMPSTMAGNSWVWGTKWTLAHQGPKPLCYFGNPYDNYIRMVKSLGGSFEDDTIDSKPDKPTTGGGGDTGGTSGGGGNSSGGNGDGDGGSTDITDNIDTVEPDNGVDVEDIIDMLEDSATSMISKVTNLMKINLTATNIGQTKHTNRYFMSDRMYSNTIRVTPTGDFNEYFDNEINDIDNSIDDEWLIVDNDSGSNADNSVEPNGEKGDIVGGVFLYDELPQKYKKLITIDLPEEIKGTNWFTENGAKGTQNEFVYYYLTQLSGVNQPKEDDTGENPYSCDLYKLYYDDLKGGVVTHKPTIGYGFSAKYPYGNSGVKRVGNAGVVVAVMEDGKYLCASFNQKPYYATSRKVCYFVLDGIKEDYQDEIIFFAPISD